MEVQRQGRGRLALGGAAARQKAEKDNRKEGIQKFAVHCKR